MYVDKDPISDVIYVHDITIEKFAGSVGRFLLVFARMMGSNALRNTTLLTTKWDRDTRDNGKLEKERREKRFKDGPWQALIKQGASVRMIDLLRGRSAYRDIAKEVLQNIPTTLQIQEELVDKKLQLNETSASQMLNKQLRKATESFQQEIHGVLQHLQKQYSKQVQELRKNLKEEGQRLRDELQKSKQSREALQREFDSFKTIELGKARQLQQTIDELRRPRRQQQRSSSQAAPPQPTLEIVSAPAYSISVHHCNSVSSLSVIEKTCLSNGSWTQISDGHKLIIPWSGNSGFLHFRSPLNEHFGVVVEIHNYFRWCDIVTDFNVYPSASSHHSRY